MGRVYSWIKKWLKRIREEKYEYMYWLRVLRIVRCYNKLKKRTDKKRADLDQNVSPLAGSGFVEGLNNK